MMRCTKKRNTENSAQEGLIFVLSITFDQFGVMEHIVYHIDARDEIFHN